MLCEYQGRVFSGGSAEPGPKHPRVGGSLHRWGTQDIAIREASGSSPGHRADPHFWVPGGDFGNCLTDSLGSPAWGWGCGPPASPSSSVSLLFSVPRATKHLRQ